MNQPTPTPPERGAGIRPCLISSPPGGVRGGFTVPMHRRKAEGVLHEPVAATVKTVKRRQIIAISNRPPRHRGGYRFEVPNECAAAKPARSSEQARSSNRRLPWESGTKGARTAIL